MVEQVENGIMGESLDINSKVLQFKILEFIYNSFIVGHLSRAKTYKIVQ